MALPGVALPSPSDSPALARASPSRTTVRPFPEVSPFSSDRRSERNPCSSVRSSKPSERIFSSSKQSSERSASGTGSFSARAPEFTDLSSVRGEEEPPALRVAYSQDDAHDHSRRLSSDLLKGAAAAPPTASGQVALARSRDFAAVFSRCRAAIASIETSTSRARFCVALQEELEGEAAKVEAMLFRIEELFHRHTGRTIVSLTQLCTALEDASRVSALYCRAPSFRWRLFSCSRASRTSLLATEELCRSAKAVKMYAVALLLEHGFKASDLATFSQPK